MCRSLSTWIRKHSAFQSSNGPDQRLATNGLATTHDDARESFASGGSGPSRGLAFAPPPHNRMILPAPRGCGPFENARFAGLHNHGPLQRGIGPPLEAQRHDASGGWTSHQVLRAQAVGGSRDEPTTFGPATKHLQLDQGHAGDHPTAYRYGPLLKPQATEPGWNDQVEQLATNWLTTPQGAIASLLQRLVRLVLGSPMMESPQNSDMA